METTYSKEADDDYAMVLSDEDDDRGRKRTQSAALMEPVTPVRAVEADATPQARDLALLRRVKETIGLFGEDKCLERSIYELEESILCCLTEPGKERLAVAISKASDIAIMMQTNGCNNGQAYINDLVQIQLQLQHGKLHLSLASVAILIDKIQPLRVREVLARLSQIHNVAPEIENEHVVLLIGRTGAGKSTTVQYLAGQKMVRKHYEISPGRISKNHIEAESPATGNLQRVAPSAAMTSATKDLIPVEVHVGRAGPTLFLCDAPGFDDTDGAEGDIIQAYGVVKALQGAKSVRILALQSKMDFGSRGDGLQTLANILSRIIFELDYDKMKAVQFGFTLFTEIDDLKAQIGGVCARDVSKQSQAYKVVVDALDSVANDPLMIDPLNEIGVRRTLDLLAKLSPIDPKDLVCTPSARASSVIEHQLQIDVSNVGWAIRRGDLLQAKQYFKNVDGLVNIFQDKERFRAHALSEISSYFADMNRKVIHAFDQRIDSSEVIPDEDFEQLQRFANDCEVAQGIWGSWISNLASEETLTSELANIVQRRIEVKREQDWHLNDVRLGNLIATAKKLGDSFRNAALEAIYLDLIMSSQLRAKQRSKDARQYTTEQRFDKVASILAEMQGACGEVADCCKAEADAAIGFIVAKVEEAMADPVMRKHNLTHSDVDSIRQHLDALESLRSTGIEELLTSALGAESSLLPSPFEKVIQMLRSTFDGFATRIRSGLDTGDMSSEEAEQLLSQMRIIRGIPQLEAPTAESYHGTLSAFRHYTTQLQKEAETAVTTLNQKAQMSDYRRLAKRLATLQRFCELDKDNIGGTSAFERVKEEISIAVATAKDKMARLCKGLNAHRVKSLDEAIQVYNAIGDMQPLCSQIATVRDGMLDIDKELRSAVEPINLHFERLFESESVQLDHSRSRRETLENALRAVDLTNAQLGVDGHASLDGLMKSLYDAQRQLSDRESTNEAEVATSNAAIENIIKSLPVTNESLIRKQLSAELAAHTEHIEKLKDEFSRERIVLIEQRDQLQTLVSTTSSLLSIPKLSEEESSWLRSNDILRIHALKEEYLRLEDEARTLPKSAKANFRSKQLEPKLVDQAMRFHEAMSAVRVWDEITTEKGPIIPEDALEGLTRYVVSYTEFFLQDFVFHLDDHAIPAIANLDKNSFPGIIRSLVSCLERFKSLDCSTEIQAILSTAGAEYAPTVRTKLNELRQTLSIAIGKASSENERKQLSLLVDIAHSLAEVDFQCDSSLLPHGNFRSLWETSAKLLQEENESGLDGFQKALNDHNFEEAAQLLSSVSGLSRAKVERLNRDLESALLRFLMGIRSLAEELAAKIEEKDPLASNTTGAINQLCRDCAVARLAALSSDVQSSLREPTQETLSRCHQEVRQLLTEKISQGCQRIKGIIDLDSFAEAEQYLENIQSFREKLASCIDTERVANDIKEVVEKLDILAEDIAKREAFADISKWAEYSPKKLVETLVELQKKITSTGRYAQAKRSALERTFQCYSAKFEDAEGTADYDKLKLIKDDLERAKEYLPSQHMNDYNDRLARLCARIDLEGQNSQKRMEQALGSLERADEESFGRVCSLYMESMKKNPRGAQQILDGITSSLILRKDEVNLARSTQAALEKLNVMFLYERMFHFHTGVGHMVETTIHTLRKRAGAHVEVMQNFLEREPTEVQTAAEEIHACLSFTEPQRRPGILVFDQTLRTALKGALENVSTVMSTLDSELDAAYKSWELPLVSTCCQKLLKWCKLVEYIEKVRLLQPMSIRLRVNGVIDAIFHEIRKQLEMPLITEDTKQFSKDRQNAVKKCATWYKHLLVLVDPKQFNVSAEGVDTKSLVAYKLSLDKTIRDYGESLLRRAAQQNLSEEECIEFRIHYELLKDLDAEKVFAALGLGTKYVQVAQSSILEKIKTRRESIEQMSSSEVADVAPIANILVDMKKLEQNLLFGPEIHESIDRALQFFKEKQQKNQGVGRLSAVLSLTDYGNKLISDHKSLSGEDLRMRREKMQKQDDLKLMLERLEGDDLDRDELRKMFGRYKTVYDDLLKRGLGRLVAGSTNLVDEAVEKVKTTIQQSHDKRSRTFTLSSFAPEALASVCCVWTLLNTQDYNEDRGNDKMAYVLTPHVAQIVSVFRILGLGYNNRNTNGTPPSFAKSLRHCLVEVGTGEGKSFVMAMVASILALMGCDVDCSCYSEYLSQRDRDSFATVFQALGIEQFVQYNTFNKICENLLNSTCNIREQIRDAILRNDDPKGVGVKARSSDRPRVLLIDEVDVFLSERFYGGMYTPSIVVAGGKFKLVMDFIWEKRGTMSAKQTGYECNLSWRELSGSPVYQDCMTSHKKWEPVIQEAFRDMLQALRTFNTIHYRVEADSIQYLEGEAYVSNVMHGYQTVWAYYHEFNNRKISAAALHANTGLLLKCGVFSYAEIPKKFQFISGVTGTLRTLSEAEKTILTKEYGIQSQTFMPSVFGENNRNYNPASDVNIVASQEDFYETLKRDIDEKCRAKRAVLVFFQDLQGLVDFYGSSHFESFRVKGTYQVIAENVAISDREMRIKRAGTEGMVTLLTATFGRGTDFVCRNPQILANGGIHVLQTFYSEEKSEEYQIMGRGARQGDRGSYGMVLLDEKLEWVLGPDYKQVVSDARQKGTPIHQLLEANRESKYEAKCRMKSVGIKQRQQEHEESLSFMDSIQTRTLVPVISCLQRWNKVAPGSGSRTVLLMDATGSMSSCLEAAKETVCVMFERAAAILCDNGLPPDGFLMQLVIYRNYSSCMFGQLLEFSSWESNPTRLRDFMRHVRPAGGQGNEAIEIGLAHAVRERDECGIDQVILIGDMPPNTREEVRSKRSGLLAVGVSSFPETYWEDEIAKLQGIPVHAFYVHPSAQQVFGKIAQRTGGRCAALAIDGPGGAEMLTSLVTEEILRKAGGTKGEDLVREYKRRFASKTYTS